MPIFFWFLRLIGVYKLLLLVLVRGPQLSSAQLVLAVNVISLTIRVIWLIIDPLGAYGTTTLTWIQIGCTSPYAFCISGVILITLYWHEMMLKSGKKINMFLSKMLWPFLGVCGLLFVIEFFAGLGRALFWNGLLITVVTGSIYALVVVSLLVFFIVTKVRLSAEFSRLNKKLRAHDGATSGEKKLGVATNLVVGIATVLVFWLLGLIVFCIGPLFWTPIGYCVVWIVLLTGMTLLCFLQIMIIRAPERSWRWILFGACHRDPDRLLSGEDSSTMHKTTTSYASAS